MTENSVNLLEKWAYIMIILVCSVILLTLFTFFLYNLINNRKKIKLSCLKGDDQSLSFVRKKDTFLNQENKTNYFHNICLLSKDSNKNKSFVLDKSQQRKSSILKNNQSYQGDYDTKIVESHNYCKTKNFEFSLKDHNQTEEKKSDDEDDFLSNLSSKFKTLLYLNSKNKVTSNVSEIGEKNFDFKEIKKMDFNRKNSNSVLNCDILNEQLMNLKPEKNRRKIQNKRNLSLPSDTKSASMSHSVKFKSEKDENRSFSDDASSSDEYHYKSQIALSNRSSKFSLEQTNRLSEYSNSTRKMSSGSSYYQYSVVDLYKKKRMSDASVIGSKTNELRRYIINQSNMFIDPGIKRVTLGQQESNDSLISVPTEQLKIKSKVSTCIQKPLLSPRLYSPRRFSVITPSNNEKFWVPTEIALSSQLERQRSSLPNNVLQTTYDYMQNQSEKLRIKQSFGIFFIYIIH